MKVTKLGSATVFIEVSGKKIICDPWLIDGIYYGSWCNYPPIDVSKYDFAEIDYVYISHVHPDHFDPRTMQLIDKSVPVIIHKYHKNFLKVNIERLGFKVLEVENGVPFKISDKSSISIFAADNCDPSICGHMFGCITSEIKGSMQLDSLCVIQDDQYVLVNTNDCPFGISENTLKRVKNIFGKIDFVLVGYTSASLYPHCMLEYNNLEMQKAKDKARNIGLSSGLNTLKVLKPINYMPFAGTYILGGMNAHKNMNLPLPALEETVAYFDNELELEKIGSKGVLLNYGESFCLSDKTQTRTYVPIDTVERESYIENVARTFKYEFEDHETPSNDELKALMKDALPRLQSKQIELNFFEDLNLVFDLSDNKKICINLMQGDIEIIENHEMLENYHRFKLDVRLLKLVLSGPRYANWNNIEIGAMLNFARKPDVYRMDVHILINALHV